MSIRILLAAFFFGVMTCPVATAAASEVEGTLSCSAADAGKSPGFAVPVSLQVTDTEVRWKRGNLDYEEYGTALLARDEFLLEADGRWLPRSGRTSEWRLQGVVARQRDFWRGELQLNDSTGGLVRSCTFVAPFLAQARVSTEDVRPQVSSISATPLASNSSQNAGSASCTGLRRFSASGPSAAAMGEALRYPVGNASTWNREE